MTHRWKPFDPARNWPDLGTRFINGERVARAALLQQPDGKPATNFPPIADIQLPADKVSDDQRDLDWATVLKRTFESYLRGERPNMYGEWIQW